MKLSTIGTILQLVAEGMLELLESTTENISNNTDEEDATYNYFMTLSYQEQEEYFKSNKYLNMYMDREYYPNSKHYTARGASRIAKMYNREFTNKNYIY